MSEPSLPDLLRRADAELAGGKPDAARAILDLAYLIAPDDAGIRYRRGRALAMLGRYQAAIAELDAAIAGGGGCADAWLQRGAAQLALAEWTAADADCSQALRLDDGLADAWGIRGRARYRLGRLAEAAADLDRAIALASAGRRSENYYWRGLARRDAGCNREAIGDFTAAITGNDRYTEAYVARGKAYAALGEMGAARSDWAVAAQMLHQSH